MYVQKSASEAVDIARKVFPNVECKCGDEGLDEIIRDSDVIGVIVALAGQIQVHFVIVVYCLLIN